MCGTGIPYTEYLFGRFVVELGSFRVHVGMILVSTTSKNNSRIAPQIVYFVTAWRGPGSLGQGPAAQPKR